MRARKFTCVRIVLVFYCLCTIFAAHVNSAIITDDLRAKMTQSGSAELIPILIILNEQVDQSTLQKAKSIAPVGKTREAVVTELKSKAINTQSTLKAYLQGKQNEGKVAGIVYLWIINGIGLKATQDVINEIGAMAEVNRIVLDEDEDCTSSGAIVETSRFCKV